MENLYKTLRDKKIHINSMEGDLVKGDYNLFFLEQFIPRIINYTIDKIELKDIKNYDGVDIPANYKIHFLYSYDTTPAMSIDENDIFFHISSKNYDVLINRILAFFAGSTISNIEKEIATDRIRAITINTTVTFLIVRYGIETNNDKRFKDSLSSTNKLINNFKNKMSSSEEIIATDVHANLYESEFLDNYVVGLIKKHIDALTQRNFVERLNKNIPIQYQLMISSIPTDNPEKIYVPEELLDAFLNEVGSFLKFYNLGTLELGSNWNAIRFDTNINDLTDAYYMEKQRIEHYTSGDYLLATDPNAKRLVKLNNN